MLTIGELAARTETATSALRYYEEVGLLSPTARVSGQRRYGGSVVDLIGVIKFLQECGFSLREIKRLVGTRSSARVWKDLAERKLGELDATIARATAARTAIEHALSCPRENVLECPNFWGVVRAFLGGQPLEAAHPR